MYFYYEVVGILIKSCKQKNFIKKKTKIVTVLLKLKIFFFSIANSLTKFRNYVIQTH